MGLARLTLVVSKYEKAHKGHEYKYIASNSTRLTIDSNIAIPNMSVGHYIIFVKCDWIRQEPDVGCVGIYTSGRGRLNQIDLSKSDRFLYKTFLDHARKNPNKQMLR
jgi:hypothetical protein